MTNFAWPEPLPMSECKAEVNEFVLCYLYVPQKKDGGWFVCWKNKHGAWFTDNGERCVPRAFVPLPPKIDVDHRQYAEPSQN